MNYLDELGLTSTPKVRLPKPPPRKRPERKEDKLHVAVRKFLQLVIAPPGVLSGDKVLWYSIETRNAGKPKVLKNGRKINLEGIGRKARGCIAGVPDVHFHYGGATYMIELKYEDGSVSDDQRDLHAALSGAGVHGAICRSVEEVAGQLRKWKLPHRAARF